MFRIILQEKISDRVNNIIYIFLVTINIICIYILINVNSLIKAMYKSEWFKSKANGYSGGDAYSIKKIAIMKVLGNYFIAVSAVILVLLIIYIIISHISKWVPDIALLHIIGYRTKNIIFYLMIRNGIDIIAVGAVGYICAKILWKVFIKGILFNKLINLTGADTNHNVKIFILCMLFIYFAQMFKAVRVYKTVRNKSIRKCLEE